MTSSVLSDAFSPSVRPPLLPESDVSYAVEDTAVGRLLLSMTSDGRLVTSAYVPDAAAESMWLQRVADVVSPRVLRHASRLDPVRRELADYLEGGATGFSVEVDLALASDFQRTVLSGLATQVGYGASTTYGALATAISRPGAARAVGSALGANPVCVVVPCHRVLPTGGSVGGDVGGYAGGPAAKEYLLALESRRTAH